MKQKSSLFLLFYTTILFAPIYETNNIKSIKRHLSKKNKLSTLIVFDLDNTLIKTVHPKAKPGYYYYLLQKFQNDGLNYDDALKKALDIHLPYLAKTNVTTTEKNTTKFIKELQANGYKTIALTARSIVDPTIKQLNSLDIKFNIPENIPYQLTTKKLFQPIFYKEGIVFSQNNNKGHALKLFLEKANYQPKKIIFVDDKHKHVKNVEYFAKQNNIEFVGLRYGRLDYPTEPTVSVNQRNQLAR